VPAHEVAALTACSTTRLVDRVRRPPETTVGVHSGTVPVGVVASAQRVSDFTALDDLPHFASHPD